MSVKRALALTLVLLALPLASCAGAQKSGSFPYGEAYIDSHLTSDYWIVYKSGQTVECRRTDEGYYYATGSGEQMTEQLFIKNGEEYTMYEKNPFFAVFAEQPVANAKEMAESMMASSLSLMKVHLQMAHTLKKAGSEIIAERDCAKYTTALEHSDASLTYWIDKETGLCLKSAAGAMTTFECTKFQTGGVTLPEAEVFEYGQAYIDSHLTGDYWIVYTSPGATTECMRTDMGYYYATGSGEQMNEQWYIKNGEGYTLYAKNPFSGAYNESPGVLTKEMAERAMAATQYMNMHVVSAAILQKDGSETIAGRDCAKYTASGTSYWIDKETGVCLKQAQSAMTTFECTMFQTEGVTLPAYQ